LVLPGLYQADHYPLIKAPTIASTIGGPGSPKSPATRALDVFSSSVLVGGVVVLFCAVLVVGGRQRDKRIRDGP
jgi:hypothetical protein